MPADRITVPKAQVDAFKTLVSLPAESLKNFEESLMKLEAYSSIHDIAKNLSERLGATFESLLGVCRMFVGLYQAFIIGPSKMPAEKLAEDLVQSCKQLKLAPDDYNWGPFKAVLQGVMSKPDSPLALLTHAYGASMQNSYTLGTTSVGTDIRPIFALSSDQPKCCIIVHQLIVHYFVEDGQRRIVFSLDRTDLSSLQTQIQEALAKEEVLRKTQAKIGINTIDYYER